MLGSTILEKRRYVLSNLDHLRKILMYEPRGHKDMYGALLVETDLEEADMAVLFMHNEGEMIVILLPPYQVRTLSVLPKTQILSSY